MTALLREFRATADGYALDIPEAATELRVERLRRDRGELVAELTASCGLPGTRSTTGVLSIADLNLSSARARTERAKLLADRSVAPEMDWVGLLEDLCQRVIGAERSGQPAVLLRDVERPPADDAWEVDPGVRLLRRHPVTLFGSGGDLKSYLALHWAVRLANAGIRVLFVDWEFAAEDHRDRLERLAGPDMPDIRYVRAERPMTVEAERLRRIVVTDRIDYVIADSIAFACDGPPESAEIAAGYFRAVRSLGVGSLHIAHVTKAEGGDRMPFGSAFWANGSRATWNVKRSADTLDDGAVRIALFNRKSNVGALAPAIGYAVTFSADRTRFERQEVASIVDLASALPIRVRMASALRRGAMTIAEIASEIGAEVEAVRMAAKRGSEPKPGHRPWCAFVVGPDGITRIGLAAEAS